MSEYFREHKICCVTNSVKDNEEEMCQFVKDRNEELCQLIKLEN